MEIVKGDSIQAGARSFLIIGVEKSGKTSFMGTAAKAMKKSLIFACEEGTLQRLGGIPGIDFVLCYVTPEDLKKAAELPTVKNCTDMEKKAKELMKAAEGFAWKRFTDAHTEILLNPNHGYELGGVDSINYLQDMMLKRYEEVNNKTGFDLWRDVKKDSGKYCEQMKVCFQYYIVTVHVKLADDETVNKEMFSAALQGSYRDVVGGKFDAVLHALTKTGTDGKAQYLLQAQPDFQHKAGIRVPFGCEGMITKELPNDFVKIQELLKGGKK